MRRLGFGLTDPSGSSIWTQRDPLRDDPAVVTMLGQLFGWKASGARGAKSSLDPGDSVVPPPETPSTFSCRVMLEKKVNLPPSQGRQVGVEIQDLRIEPGGIYALDVEPRLAYRDDLQVAPALACATKPGELLS